MLNRRLSGALLFASLVALLLSIHATGCSSSNGTTSDAGGDVATDTTTFPEAGHEGGVDAMSDAASCPSGQTSCSGTCTNTATDPKNCGVCGATCGSGLVCAMSTCALSCGDASGLTQCGSGCYDTTSDSDNCGSCGNKCPTGEVCNNSTCGFSCGAGSTLCNGACVDTNTDNANCGKCGTACVAGTVCGGGTCSLTCMNGYTTCGADAGAGYCANTQTDNTNCGSCGHQCSSGQVCSLGVCSTSCGSGLVDCSGNCVNPQTDNGYCGATAGCNVGDAGGSAGTVCPMGTACTAGQCTISCPAGEVDCSGVCIDPTSSNTHCGVQPGCTGGSACTGGTVCSNGSCQTTCGANLVNCGGECIDPKTNLTYCGATSNCSGMNAGTTCQPGQVCTAGVCQLTCSPGLLACGGTCVDPNTNNLFCGATSNCQGANSGNICNAGYICSGGNCLLTCQAGLIDCNNTCVNPLTDPVYCGATGDCTTGTNPGTNCTTMGGGYVCTGGNPDGGLPKSSCQLSCQTGLVDCQGTCIDPTSSSAYCGATTGCGSNGGSAGTPCTVVGSACMPTGSMNPPFGVCGCPTGQVDCTPTGGVPTCIDPTTNNEFCGVGAGCSGGINCGSGTGSIVGSSCTPTGSPAVGVCTCPTGQVNCTPTGGGPTCIDPTTDNEFCGVGAGCSGGVNCGSGTGSVVGSSCKPTGSPAVGVCTCPTTGAGVVEVSCTPTGFTQAECIDPSLNNEFCGANSSCNTYNDCVSAISGSACTPITGTGGQPVSPYGDCECPTGQVACAGACIDPTTNNTYCGATAGCLQATMLTPTPNGFIDCSSGLGSITGSACTPTGSPAVGVCTCAPGQLSCDLTAGNADTATCVDPSRNSQFCGAVLTGTCTDPSTTNPPTAPSPNNTDPNYAGQNCAATPGYVCNSSTCSLTCASGLTKCPTPGTGFVCADTNTDPDNCGGCSQGAGATGAVCSSGICSGTTPACQGETLKLPLGDTANIEVYEQCEGAWSCSGSVGFSWTDTTPTPLPVGATVASITIAFAQGYEVADSGCTDTLPAPDYLTLNGNPLSTFSQNGLGTLSTCGPSSTSGCYQPPADTCQCTTTPEQVVITDTADLALYNVGGTNELLLTGWTDECEGLQPPTGGSTFATVTVAFSPE